MQKSDSKKIQEHIEAFFEERSSTNKILDKWNKDPNRKPFGWDQLTIGQFGDSTIITWDGARHFAEAAYLILRQAGQETRCSAHTAHKFLHEAVRTELERRWSGKKFSVHAIVQRTLQSLKTLNLLTGTYIYPAVISGPMNDADLTFGPVRIVSRQVFESEYSSLLESAMSNSTDEYEFQRDLAKRWRNQNHDYHQFILVKVSNFEEERGRAVGIDAANWILNSVRLLASWYDGSKIHLAGERRREIRQAFLMVNSENKIQGSHTVNFAGASFEDNWPKIIEQRLDTFSKMLSAVADRFVRGDSAGEPVFERIQYANILITESFEETSDRMRLVKFVSAMEALSVLPRHAKKETLAHRCGLAVSVIAPEWNSPVSEAVKTAYQTRNSVVHGDAPSERDAYKALSSIEQYAFLIVMSLVRILVILHNDKRPQSIRPLRRMIDKYYGDLESKEASECGN